MSKLTAKRIVVAGKHKHVYLDYVLEIFIFTVLCHIDHYWRVLKSTIGGSQGVLLEDHHYHYWRDFHYWHVDRHVQQVIIRIHWLTEQKPTLQLLYSPSHSLSLSPYLFILHQNYHQVDRLTLSNFEPVPTLPTLKACQCVWTGSC